MNGKIEAGSATEILSWVQERVFGVRAGGLAVVEERREETTKAGSGMGWDVYGYGSGRNGRDGVWKWKCRVLGHAGCGDSEFS